MNEISDLLERFRRGPELLAMVLTGVFGEEEDFIPEPGKWSIRQIIAHLADSEMVCAHRMRQIITPGPPRCGDRIDAKNTWPRNESMRGRNP